MTATLPSPWPGLVQAAKEASRRAYAPYSGLSVGAAVLAEGGEIYCGCNVENASFGLTICAERNAVFQAVAAGERKITHVAIYVSGDRPATPCGACRQVLLELAPDASVLCACDGEKTLLLRVADLLPEAFGAANVKVALVTRSVPPADA
ncbi:MAG: cytidine deaminase [Planctomycetia bacterium]|nr:cytidine deaminase [Planctomycetia bacterium]